MSWLYRPTPVIPMGRGEFASQNVVSGVNGATMRGVVPGWNYAPGLGKAKAVQTGKQPWIKLSGSMGDFIPNGLGGLGDDFYSGAYASPIIPDAQIVPFVAPDLGTPSWLTSFSPIAPDFSGGGIPSSFFAGAFAGPNIPTSQVAGPIAPPTFARPPAAGAGATGTGIPGTQPLSTASLVATGGGLLTSILSIFQPTAPKAISTGSYATLPGVGGPPAPSSIGAWFAKSSLISGTPNSTVLVGAVAVVVLISALGRGGKRK